ncbi:MAG: response regulator [Chitinispirillaceae bacterium]|nr:response regulator [Chitinispirillaceae bacterium]
MKILLVDDSTTMRRIQRNQLNGLGVTDIVEASNGKEALDVLAANMPIDIVLLDWNMPEMTGIELLKHIRTIDSYSKVKVIMCTSEAEKEKVIEALKLGANNYIVKPFTPEVLKEKLGL